MRFNNNRKWIFLYVLIIGLLGSGNSFAEFFVPEKKVQTKKEVEAEVKEKTSPASTIVAEAPAPKPEPIQFSGYLSTAHNMGFAGEDIDNSTDFELVGKVKLSDKHSLKVVQQATKLYEVPEGDKDFAFVDTSLYHYMKLSDGLSLRSGITIPVSEASQEEDIITKPNVMLTATKSFMDNKLLLMFSPFFKYHWNKYNTTTGGSPLPFATLGKQLVGTYQLLPKLGYTGVFVGSSSLYNNKEKPIPSVGLLMDNTLAYSFTDQFSANVGYAHSTSVKLKETDDPAMASYQFKAGVAYALSDTFSTNFGISHGESYERGEKHKIIIFDPDKASVSFGLDISF
ncbi:hypothetical protein ACFLRA_00805 [Bdellovibrionota bacterium]